MAGRTNIQGGNELDHSNHFRAGFPGLLHWALAFGIGAISSSAYAETKELLVRYKSAVKSKNMASALTLRNGGEGAEEVQLVLGNQGLVKLKFSTAQEAEAAKEKLLRSSEVENVAPNFYYRPAMKYKF